MKISRIDASKVKDLGAAVNFADSQMRGEAGEIWVTGSGVISTPITLTENHVLRLGEGTYKNQCLGPAILMRDFTQVIGSGVKTMLWESNQPGSFVVISSEAHHLKNGLGNFELQIGELKIVGKNPGFNSTQSCIELGNSIDVLIYEVYLYRTRAIGIEVGGTGALHKFAARVRIEGCTFHAVASQNIGIVNGRAIWVVGNTFLKPGQKGGPGATCIDVETNGPEDTIQHIYILGNTLKAYGSELEHHGDFIDYQILYPENTGGPALIAGNTMNSLSHDLKNELRIQTSNGLRMAGTPQDVEISGNYFKGCTQHAMHLFGTRLKVFNNQMFDTGTGGIWSFEMAATDSLIWDNKIEVHELGTSVMYELEGSDRNQFIGNEVGEITLVGKESTVM